MKKKPTAITTIEPPAELEARPSRQLRDFAPPRDTTAAIYLGPEGWEFQYREGSSFIAKQVMASSVRLAFNDVPIDSGWIHPNAIRWGATSAGAFTVGFFPARVYRFKVDFGTRVRVLNVPMPSLVFSGVASSYYVWATIGKVFSPKAELFHAPLPNLNNLGLICFGANKLPNVANGGFGPSWEMFWDSPFSDHHMGGRSKVAIKDVREHLLRLSKERAQTFPKAALVPSKTTLEAAVDRLINRIRRISF